jgi:hypothetical protein
VAKIFDELLIKLDVFFLSVHCKTQKAEQRFYPAGREQG